MKKNYHFLAYIVLLLLTYTLNLFSQEKEKSFPTTPESQKSGTYKVRVTTYGDDAGKAKDSNEITVSGGEISFDYKQYLFGESSTLSVWVVSLDDITGHVVANGGDSQQPTIPFTWDWGDGSENDGWFPQEHTYADISRNYIVSVTSHYNGGKIDSAETLIRFVAPSINTIALPESLATSIPTELPDLTTRLYSINPDLTIFDDSFFDLVTRSNIEYILTVVATNQMDFTNQDVFLIDGGFRQVMLRDPSFAGMYSIWFSNPVAFGVGDYGFQGTIEYSSFFHEMGHNFSLNSPADYYYGGKIDGNANAIFSETMAQIFQHSAGYEIINKYKEYGLSEDIMFDIKQSFISSIKLVRNSYEEYINSGSNFSSWNDPSTPDDETFNTFMTIAYQFFKYAENSGLGYKLPLKRMMELLQVFNEDLRLHYDQHNNTVEADIFRATLMTTAISYAFSENLCNEFKSLNFPISDAIYNELILLVAKTQTITITHGKLNMISFNIESPDLAVDILLDDLATLLVAQDDDGKFYIPPYGVNTIGSVDLSNGYQVYITGSTDDNVENDGVPLVPQDYSQALTNTKLFMIGYPYQTPHPVTDVFASIAASVVVVQDDEGRFWIPLYGVNTIGNMQPGKGYQIYVNQTVNLSYPALSSGLAKAGEPVAELLEPSHFQFQRTGLPYAIVVTGSDKALAVSDEVSVFAGELCVGAAVFTGEYPLVIAAWEGNEEYKLTGFKAGESISLRVWNVSNSQEVEVAGRFVSSSESTFRGGPISVVSLEDFVPSVVIPTDYGLDQNYPNPFNPKTVIEYQLPADCKVSLRIYNLLGQEIRSLVEATKKAGYHKVSWDGKDEFGKEVSSGMYLYTIEAGDFRMTRKMVRMR